MFINLNTYKLHINMKSLARKNDTLPCFFIFPRKVKTQVSFIRPASFIDFMSSGNRYRQLHFILFLSLK